MTAPLALFARANCATTSRVIGIITVSRVSETYGSGRFSRVWIWPLLQWVSGRR